jgi:hypothetical protein
MREAAAFALFSFVDKAAWSISNHYDENVC